jgi:hypothetical protein
MRYISASIKGKTVANRSLDGIAKEEVTTHCPFDISPNFIRVPPKSNAACSIVFYRILMVSTLRFVAKGLDSNQFHLVVSETDYEMPGAVPLVW